MRFPMVMLLMFGLSGEVVTAGDIEEPRWRLLGEVDSVELRYYEPSIQATTTLRSSRETSAGFRRLAGFIFGDNSGARKIAMTAPVQETLQTKQPVMAFTMPAAYTLDELPTPSDPRITVKAIPGKTVAIVRFSGWATQSKIARKRAELLASLQRHDIDTVGFASLNQYNTPWTPPFLRRNEIMVEISSLGLASAMPLQPGG